MLRISLGLVLLAIGVDSDVDMVVMHNNDFHARYEQTNVRSSRCLEDDVKANKCYGGSARMVTIVNEIRRNYTNTLLLSGGDEFQGTFWFYHFGGELPARLMNRVQFDASALGNHEFDSGPDGLVPFLALVTFPILAANMDISKEPKFKKRVSDWTTLTLDSGDKVGVAGYTLARMPDISSPGDTLSFSDEIVALRKCVKEMKEAGLNKIIAIGHSGFKRDKEIAEAIDDLDVVVGGHTNTFLFTGSPPSTEKPADKYPVVITHKSGKKTLVVQAYAYGKYMGFLQVTFNNKGEVTKYGGNPILLDSSIKEDPGTLNFLEPYKQQIAQEMQKVVVVSYVKLYEGGKGTCRDQECNLGNLVADSMLWANARRGKGTDWTDVAIAITNAGGMRDSLEQGNITYGDISAVMPFKNTIDVIDMKGKHFREVLEHAVAVYEDRHGQFLQFSGVKVTYNVKKPVGQRVHDVKVRCAECDIPVYESLQDEKVYKIVLPSYLAKGGDYFSMIPKNTIKRYIIEKVDMDIFIDYIKKMAPITIGTEGRITILEDDPCHASSAATYRTNLLIMCVVCLLKLFFI